MIKQPLIRTPSHAKVLVLSYCYSFDFSDEDHAENPQNRYTFTAREFDSENQSYYYRARQYNPSTGRFNRRDPIGYSAGVNLYTYVRNNPINRRDPYGLLETTLTTKYGDIKIKRESKTPTTSESGKITVGSDNSFTFEPNDKAPMHWRWIQLVKESVLFLEEVFYKTSKQNYPQSSENWIVDGAYYVPQKWLETKEDPTPETAFPQVIPPSHNDPYWPDVDGNTFKDTPYTTFNRKDYEDIAGLGFSYTVNGQEYAYVVRKDFQTFLVEIDKDNKVASVLGYFTWYDIETIDGVYTFGPDAFNEGSSKEFDNLVGIGNTNFKKGYDYAKAKANK